ncbi:M24 family metallopeptidase [Pseudothermotoga sp. U03pept]|uniref:M24 family metallopeptidase n=1 Tax=Pseudothermotoga sp. U03pept TaxID=3447012 RepID=UPI003F03BDFA
MNRVEQFVEKIEKMGVEAAIIYNVEYSSKPSTYYLSGFTGSFSVLVISREKQFIITDSRYLEQVKQQTSFEVVEYKGNDIFESVRAVVDDLKPKTIGLEFQRVSHNVFLKLNEKIKANFVSIDSVIDTMRTVKSQEEIDNIKKAITVSEKAYLKTLECIKEDMTEMELAAEFEYNMKKFGAQGIAFETIVISGPRTSMPHGRPSNKKIKRNEPITFDFGAVVNGYCADITRTIVFGKADDEFKRIYQTVYEAQTLALEKGSAKMSGKMLDSVARNHIESKGYGRYFGHGLGHGLGIEVHESPRVNQSNQELLPQNAVVTIEPGIYIEGKYGVRIEEDVVVSESSLERLTSLSRELVEVKT